jgi:hypothetical protein
LLKNDDADPEQNGLRAGQRASGEARAGEVVRDNASAELAPKRYKPNIQSRILARFPFILEIFYWLLIYWVCVYDLADTYLPPGLLPSPTLPA